MNWMNNVMFWLWSNFSSRPKKKCSNTLLSNFSNFIFYENCSFDFGHTRLCFRSLKSYKLLKWLRRNLSFFLGGYPAQPWGRQTTHLAMPWVTRSFSQHVPTSLSLWQLLTSVLHDKRKCCAGEQKCSRLPIVLLYNSSACLKQSKVNITKHH